MAMTSQQDLVQLIRQTVMPPRFAVDHADYGLECEEALEPALIAAIDEARAAGWTPDVTWPALRSLVANLEEAEIENRRTDRAIADAKLENR